MTDRWFRFQGKWHIVNNDGDEGLCRIAPLTMPEVITPDDDDPPPPDPCMGCLVEMAMRDCEDEPMDVAKGRGYIEVDPLD